MGFPAAPSRSVVPPNLAGIATNAAIHQQFNGTNLPALSGIFARLAGQLTLLQPIEPAASLLVQVPLSLTKATAGLRLPGMRGKPAK
jgi:hypothetical protein